jgi:O-antigen ligase
VNLATLRGRIPAINSALLAALFFVIPTHVAPAYFLTLLILLLLLLEGKPLAHLRTLADSPLPAIFAAYFAVFALSLLWTQDLAFGVKMVKRQVFFLLFPLYLLAARREHLRFYFAAFLASIALCVALAWYNWARLHHLPGLPGGIQVDKSIGDTAPFVDWIMYTPILAFAAYLLLHDWLFGPWLPGLRRRWLLAAFLLAVVGNALMSGGRSGVVGLIALIGLAAVQRFAQRPLLAATLAATGMALVVSAGYAVFPLFQERIDKAVEQVRSPLGAGDVSISYRLAYAKGALDVFADHPIAGAGAGDLPDEYLRINPNAPVESGRMWNPHNQYLLVLSTTGLLGGMMLVLVLAGVASLRTAPGDGLRRIQVALVVLFAVICLGESYLARSNTSLMFVLFSALVARSALHARLERAVLAKALPAASR